MVAEREKVFWYVLFAANGKAAKITSILETANIEYFFPMYYKRKQIGDSNQTKCTLQPLLRNLVFVKSSKACLEPHLKEIKLRLDIASDLYYRSLGTKKIIVVPEIQMKHFIAVAGCMSERIIYLSNEEINLKKGTRVRIMGGVFEGLEGVFMRIKGDRRVVVNLPDLFSVATAFIPTHLIQPLE